MDNFLNVLHSTTDYKIYRGKLKTLQVNLGNLCNQRCGHCHVDAGPDGKNIMSRKTIDNILDFISHNNDLILDITGGAPELNPHFDYLIRSARPLIKEVIVRSNMTVFFEAGREYLPHFFKENNVHLICSLPCYTKENVDRQRGNGVFEKSIKALRILNDLGFSKENGLYLDLAHNPNGPFLPKAQSELEEDYKHFLKTQYGITFNRLIALTNAPINRFKNYLGDNGGYAKYMSLLESNFNKEVLENLMCRNLLSVGWDGKVYDCDFNNALGLALKDEKGEIITIETIDSDRLEGKKICFGEHCFSCTAGAGSSCQGVLSDEEDSDVRDKDGVPSPCCSSEDKGKSCC